MGSWVLWLAAACALGVAEMRRGGFRLAPCAAAAAIAAIVSLLGVGLALTTVVFLLSSAIVFAAIAPAARRASRATPALRAGAAALIGHSAVVLERIANLEGIGCVKVHGEVWSARSFHEEDVFDAGERVKIVEVRGSTAVVAR